MKICEDELIGKTVMNDVGFLIGVVTGSIEDKITRKTMSLLVEPSKEIDPRLYKLNDQEDIIFPYNSIVSVAENSVIVESF